MTDEVVTALPPRYDLVVKGGRVIDPATGTDGVMDVAVTDNRIAAVGVDISRIKGIMPVFNDGFTVGCFCTSSGGSVVSCS